MWHICGSHAGPVVTRESASCEGIGQLIQLPSAFPLPVVPGAQQPQNYQRE